MSEHLTLENITPHLNEAFTLSLEQRAFVFVLVETGRAGNHEPPAGFRTPISLLFRGPSEPLFRQQMMALEHPGLGRLDLFMVPIGQQDGGYLYQSILA